MIQSVFLLQHSYELEDCEETKLIGVYSSKEEAEQAIDRVGNQAGFKDRLTGFFIDEYELDKDHWTTGFITLQ